MAPPHEQAGRGGSAGDRGGGRGGGAAPAAQPGRWFAGGGSGRPLHEGDRTLRAVEARAGSGTGRADRERGASPGGIGGAGVVPAEKQGLDQKSQAGRESLRHAGPVEPATGGGHRPQDLRFVERGDPAGPDPGGQHGPDESRPTLRSSARFSLLHLRRLVDQTAHDQDVRRAVPGHQVARTPVGAGPRPQRDAQGTDPVGGTPGPPPGSWPPGWISTRPRWTGW